MKKKNMKILLYGFKRSFLRTKACKSIVLEGNEVIIAPTVNDALHEIAKAKLTGNSLIRGIMINKELSDLSQCKGILSFIKYYSKKPPLVDFYPKKIMEGIWTPFESE